MKTNMVTGAFGYIGKYIARHLLDRGEKVKTITTHSDKTSPFGDAVECFQYDFARPDKLINHLRGADTLYNTYWVRFPYNGLTFEQALRNTETLFSSAKAAEVRKIVHISVTNASISSPLPYYKGKGEQEALLAKCGTEFCIVRPTLVFGREDILVNNIGWLIRHFPFFPIFGDGNYRIQPVYVEDVARIAIEASGAQSASVIDAIGPETYAFEQFISLIISKLHARSRPVRISPGLGIALGKLVGLALGDVLLTADELRGLMTNLLTSNHAANGTTRFSEWLEENKQFLGSSYTSEVARHFRWQRAAQPTVPTR